MMKQQEFAIVPHISAAGTRTGVVQTVPSCLDEVRRVCKEIDEVCIANTFRVLYTTSHFKSCASCECRRKNFLLANAPSFTAAHTYNCSDNSRTDTALQNSGISWKDVRSLVKKYAMMCLRSVHSPLTRNARAWDAKVSSST